MGATEIILLLMGIVLFIASFVIPEKRQTGENEARFSEEQMKELAEKEMKLIQEKMETVVDETITYAVEKTERSLERITNEKIMAINEYSDTVLKEIQRNHEEVVFLYDMLNDKHTSLKNMVKEVTKTAGDIKQAVKDAEVSIKELVLPIEEMKVESKKTIPTKTAEKKPVAKKTVAKKPVAKKTTEKVDMTVQVIGKNEGSINNNEKILAMHKSGKSNMAIAKELGLGLGEVKLVIDLFEGM